MLKHLPVSLVCLCASLVSLSSLASAGGKEAGPSAGGTGTALPDYRVADPAAPEVTVSNLLSSERFWPYHVGLTQDWKQRPGGTPIRAGTPGVLIRVGEGGLARVDFGRDGLVELPVGVTDLVAGANRVRLGEQQKMAPNFVLAIGSRLLDAGGSPRATVELAEVEKQKAFLAVFADVNDAGFESLAVALAGFQDRPGLMTIVFPQGGTPDGRVYDRLRALSWRVPFVLDFLSEPYTRTLLDPQTPLPALSLQSPDGRLLFQSSWNAQVLARLEAALAQAGIAAPVAAAPARE